MAPRVSLTNTHSIHTSTSISGRSAQASSSPSSVQDDLEAIITPLSSQFAKHASAPSVMASTAPEVPAKSTWPWQSANFYRVVDSTEAADFTHGPHAPFRATLRETPTIITLSRGDILQRDMQQCGLLRQEFYKTNEPGADGVSGLPLWSPEVPNRLTSSKTPTPSCGLLKVLVTGVIYAR
jgi:hypothetical protein